MEPVVSAPPAEPQESSVSVSCERAKLQNETEFELFHSVSTDCDSHSALLLSLHKFFLVQLLSVNGLYP